MNELTQTKKDPTILAVEIRSLQQQARIVVMSYAVEIGRRLCEAKSVVPHGEWTSWLEEKVQFSQSTAQNYMKMYERFGSEQVSLFDGGKTETIMNLPYTKALKLLAVPEEEMDEFMSENDVENMSVRELEQAIKERDAAKAEANEAKNELEKATEAVLKSEERTREAREEAENLRKQLTELENKPVEVAVEAPTPEMLEEIRAQEEKKYTEERDKLQKKLEAAEKKLQKAEEEAKNLKRDKLTIEEKAKQELREEIDKAQQEKQASEAAKNEAEARAKELERKLKLSDNSTAVFQVYFRAVQEDINRMVGLIKKAEPEQAEKFAAALKALLASVERMV